MKRRLLQSEGTARVQSPHADSRLADDKTNGEPGTAKETFKTGQAATLSTTALPEGVQRTEVPADAMAVHAEVEGGGGCSGYGRDSLARLHW